MARSMVLIGGSYDYWIANANILKLRRPKLRRCLQDCQALLLRGSIVGEVRIALETPSDFNLAEIVALESSPIVSGL